MPSPACFAQNIHLLIAQCLEVATLATLSFCAAAQRWNVSNRMLVNSGLSGAPGSYTFGHKPFRAIHLTVETGVGIADRSCANNTPCVDPHHMGHRTWAKIPKKPHKGSKGKRFSTSKEITCSFMFLPSILESSNNFQWFVPAKDTDEKGVSLLTYAFRLLFEEKSGNGLCAVSLAVRCIFILETCQRPPQRGFSFQACFLCDVRPLAFIRRNMDLLLQLFRMVCVLCARRSSDAVSSLRVARKTKTKARTTTSLFF